MLTGSRVAVPRGCIDNQTIVILMAETHFRGGYAPAHLQVRRSVQNASVHPVPYLSSGKIADKTARSESPRTAI